MKMCKSRQLLNVDQLQVGDILLSRPQGVESWLIAKLGGSRYSHAEIIVGGRISGTEFFLSSYEATTDKTKRGQLVGLVRNIPLTDYQYRLRDIRVKLPPLVKAKDITDWVEFEVLRWRDSDTSSFKEFQKLLKTNCNILNLKPYASPRVVAALTPFPRMMEFLGKRTGQVPTHIVDGLFCSQLVAKVYSEGGFPLAPLPPEEIAPRHLAELGRRADSPLLIVPKEQLIFLPGTDYSVATDNRALNTGVKNHSTETASAVRAAELVQDTSQKLLSSFQKLLNKGREK
jgi:hypothetical protein